MTVIDKLAALRKHMQEGQIDAWICANSDAHNNECVGGAWGYRKWLTGFHGSNGTVVVLADKAGLWTDSRYFIAAEEALEGTGIDLFRMLEDDVPTIEKWICDQLSEGQAVGFSGSETSLSCARKRKKAFEAKGLQLNIERNLVAEVWGDRPAEPVGAVDELSVEYAGLSFEEKLAQVRKEMAGKKLDAYLLGRTDETAWLFNVRGSDLKFCTLMIAYTLITKDTVQLMVNRAKLPEQLIDKLESAGCTLRDYEDIEAVLEAIPKKSRLLIVPDYINYSLTQKLDHCELVEERSIVTDLKAIKNTTEIEQSKAGQIDDGVAMVKFFHWLENEVAQGNPVSELSAATKLESFRAEIPDFRHIAFESIAGYKGHGALNHYSVSEETDVPMSAEGLFLIDSGGSYARGTTDITRVVPLGEVTDRQRTDYTCVLKALIRLTMAVFPKTATCAQLDGICRSGLWEHQREFKHGTGHGIGFGLEVHEGPQGFYNRSEELMKPGMLTTIEPGLYRSGAYGIRIENVVLCVEQGESDFGPFHAFETVTFCPINTRLVDPAQLSEKKLAWLNDYHATCYRLLEPGLNAEQRAWLQQACEPLSA